MAEVLSSDYAMVPVDKLSAHPRNPRRGDVAAIAESIAHNGFFGAVVAQRSTGHVLAGNHRLQAAVEAGATEVPVIWLDVDDATALRILLVDNRTADQSVYDETVLIEQLRRLKATDVGLAGSGFSDRELNRLLREQHAHRDESGELGWRLIIDCETEEEQDALVAELCALGYRAKARVVD